MQIIRICCQVVEPMFITPHKKFGLVTCDESRFATATCAVLCGELMVKSGELMVKSGLPVS